LLLVKPKQSIADAERELSRLYLEKGDVTAIANVLAETIDARRVLIAR
jgi:hypothetical protein